MSTRDSSSFGANSTKRTIPRYSQRSVKCGGRSQEFPIKNKNPATVTNIVAAFLLVRDKSVDGSKWYEPCEQREKPNVLLWAATPINRVLKRTKGCNDGNIECNAKIYS
jgi:hypothetical protein